MYSRKASTAKTRLSFPIYSADFDPESRGFLVVGGGGGEVKAGVKNQIAVLDANTCQNVADIELSREEDSVQSLAGLATDEGLLLFAGINSSQSEQNAGRNEHLRSFEVQLPLHEEKKTEAGAKMTGKCSLFNPSSASKKEAFQRLIRFPQERLRHSLSIGAIASSMSSQNEVVVFDPRGSPSVITRISLARNEEAVDLDLIQTESTVFSLTYCTSKDICEQTYKYHFDTKRVEKLPKGPRRVYQAPVTERTLSQSRFRAVRFLNSQNILILGNRPNRTGAELRIIHLYPTGPAALLSEKALPSRIKQAYCMDVCSLDSDKSRNQQVVIAISSQDVSIDVFVTDYHERTETFSPLKHYTTLRNVHEQQITKLCFSPFKSQSDSSIRLASVSYGQTVVIHRLPLVQSNASDKTSRHVLMHTDLWLDMSYLTILAVIVLVLAFIIQAFVGGFSDEKAMWPFKLLPQNVRTFLDQPARAAQI
ncbi:hypothetical protein K470DRAFT_256473 [Piedraia hortae CBS 480.64]|uniref:Guanine nucleotide-exchange factor SEC12 n=1 Tax=Piedraia hortae CBS 480.64 TaxID=1314780 RepID=A0A6A7C3V3_9PEZI|nr:hypothetical protein K470DRAFT_256473 [Piedraia hortae CBS 480.64]